jgi:hypothetical protein
VLFRSKEPVASKIAFRNRQGGTYVVQWVIRCGNDPTRLNPLGSASFCARKYYHSFRLSDGTTGEVGVGEPAGILRIDRDNRAVTVSIDGQAAAVSAANPMGQLVGFEIDVVRAATGTLSFSEFRIAR